MPKLVLNLSDVVNVNKMSPNILSATDRHVICQQ